MKIPKIIFSLSLVYAVTGYGVEHDVLVMKKDDSNLNPPISQQVDPVEDNVNSTLFINKPPAPAAPAGTSNRVISLSDIISNTVAYPAILSAEADVNASKGDKSAADMQRYPTVSASTSLNDSARISPTIQIQQPLWTGGKITGQIEEAEHLVDSAEAKMQTTTYTIALKTVSAW
jgi:outer membrane protein TolC